MSGEARVAKQTSSLTPPDYADPPFQAGFCFIGCWCRGLAQMEPCAQRISARTVSVHQDTAVSNPADAKQADFLTALQECHLYQCEPGGLWTVRLNCTAYLS